jgi:hypothetical protein
MKVKLYKDNNGNWWAELPCEESSVPRGCVLGAGDTAALALEDLAKEIEKEMLLEGVVLEMSGQMDEIVAEGEWQEITVSFEVGHSPMEVPPLISNMKPMDVKFSSQLPAPLAKPTAYWQFK